MKIVQYTTDNRNQQKEYHLREPYFGTAPAGLINGLSQIEGIEVHVISCTSRRMNIPNKLASNVYFHQPYVPKIGWGRSLFLGCTLATRRLLREIKPDIVHGQGTERDCAMEAVLSGYPNVLTIHGNMRVHAKRPENRSNPYYRLAAQLERFCLKRTNGVVAISNYTKDLVSPLAARSWLLPNAVDPRFFEIEVDFPSTPRILFVGSLNERKNPLGLVKACQRMLLAGKCTLALAGDLNPDSAYGREVIGLTASLPGISLLGFLDRKSLAIEFSRSSLLVLPTFEDNCPMVVLEAMAAGLPVAASRIGGIPDLIEHGVTGMMFDPSDVSSIQQISEQIISDVQLGKNLGAAARATAYQKYHPIVIAKAHLDIYKEIIK